MADISITPGNVLPASGADVSTNEIAGETLTAGMAVYKKAADNKLYKAQCDAATDDDVYGIALNGASAGQLVAVQKSGDITIGGTVVAGTMYVLSAAAGGICPWADLVATNYVTLIGIGASATAITLHRKTTGVQIPA